MLLMEEDISSIQGGHQKRKKCWLAIRKLLQADELLLLHKETSVESAGLLFLLLSDNQGTLTSAVVFLEHTTVKR